MAPVRPLARSAIDGLRKHPGIGRSRLLPPSILRAAVPSLGLVDFADRIIDARRGPVSLTAACIAQMAGEMHGDLCLYAERFGEVG
jgi:hypothetical protein